jgi:osmotically-inducible protein OsmY
LACLFCRPVDAVEVLVEGGWVTLSGDVEWQYQRQDAFNSVRYITDVTGVSNQIGIKPSLSAIVVKSDIEAAIKRRAAADAQTISVDLTGANVNWPRARPGAAWASSMSPTR